MKEAEDLLIDQVTDGNLILDFLMNTNLKGGEKNR